MWGTSPTPQVRKSALLISSSSWFGGSVSLVTAWSQCCCGTQELVKLFQGYYVTRWWSTFEVIKQACDLLTMPAFPKQVLYFTCYLGQTPFRICTKRFTLWWNSSKYWWCLLWQLHVHKNLEGGGTLILTCCEILNVSKQQDCFSWMKWIQTLVWLTCDSLFRFSTQQ